MSLLTIDPLETAHAYDSGDRRILAKEPTRKASAGVLFMRAGEFDQQDGSSNPMWTRLERNWYKDAKEFKQPSGVKNFMPMFVTSARLRHTPSGDPMLAGELSFSNSITIQRNTLGPGAVGHILRSRTISPTTYTATDRWFAYDQVGSVLAETDANGDVAAVHHSDAWGNRLGDWETGVWGGQRSGWAHNTKEIDGLTDLTYMYQRWYAPETGTFLSRAPYGPDVENEYGFAFNEPTSFVDALGASPTIPAKSVAIGNGLEIVSNYTSGDHGPPHLHLNHMDGSRTVKIGQNGKPLAGQPELTDIHPVS